MERVNCIGELTFKEWAFNILRKVTITPLLTRFLMVSRTLMAMIEQ